MKNWKGLMLTAALLALALSAQSARGQPTQTTVNSAGSSANSDIHANKDEAEPQKFSGKQLERRSLSAHRAAKPQNGVAQIAKACAAAVEELRASRLLIGALEAETNALRERLGTEKQTTSILAELNETRKSEGDALRSALAAKDETIKTKDAVIAAQDKLVAALKVKKPSPLKRIGDILIGAAIFAVLK